MEDVQHFRIFISTLTGTIVYWTREKAHISFQSFSRIPSHIYLCLILLPVIFSLYTIVPTRIGRTSQTLLDPLIVSDVVSVAQSGTLDLDHSDHLAVYAHVVCSHTNKSATSREIWNYRKADFAKMNNLINSTDWEKLIFDEEDIDVAVSTIKKKSPDKLSGREQRRLQWWQQYSQQQNSSTRFRGKTPSKDSSKRVPSTSQIIQNEGGFKTKLTSNVRKTRDKTVQTKNSKNISDQQKNVKKTVQKVPLKTKTAQNSIKTNRAATPAKNLSAAQNKKQSKSQANNESVNTVTKSPHITDKYVLFVGNLPLDITKEKLEDHFRKTDGVRAIRIPKVKGTDKSKGFAYIEFKDRISHRIGLRLHQTTLEGRKINVEFTSVGGGNSKERTEKLKAKNAKLAHLRKPLN